MIDCVPFSTVDSCELLPSLSVGAIMCENDCNVAHGYYVAASWLFWGMNVVYMKPYEDGME